MIMLSPVGLYPHEWNPFSLKLPLVSVKVLKNGLKHTDVTSADCPASKFVDKSASPAPSVDWTETVAVTVCHGHTSSFAGSNNASCIDPVGPFGAALFESPRRGKEAIKLLESPTVSKVPEA